MSNGVVKKSLGIVGYSCDLGGITAGSREGPKTLRKAGVIRVANSLGWEVSDYADATPEISPSFDIKLSPEELTCKYPKEVFSACSTLNRKVSQILVDGRFPLVLGGDHSLSIGSISAVADFYAARGKKIGLLWVDAHPDLNIPSTSPSKNFFGMSVAVLLGMVPGALSSLQNHPPSVQTKDLSFVGLRDLDGREPELFRGSFGHAAFAMDTIDEVGIKSVMDRALETVTKETAGFVLSFDLDACDPNFAPGTGTPMRGGLTYRESHYILERAAASGKMLAAELVELNPELDKSDQTTEVALSLIGSILGRRII